MNIAFEEGQIKLQAFVTYQWGDELFNFEVYVCVPASEQWEFANQADIFRWALSVLYSGGNPFCKCGKVLKRDMSNDMTVADLDCEPCEFLAHVEMVASPLTEPVLIQS